MNSLQRFSQYWSIGHNVDTDGTLTLFLNPYTVFTRYNQSYKQLYNRLPGVNGLLATLRMTARKTSRFATTIAARRNQPKQD